MNRFFSSYCFCILAFCSFPANALDWDSRKLENEFYAEGSAAGDINGDGHVDIVYGPFWYEGPDFKMAHRYSKGGPFIANKQYSNNFFSFILDFNDDGNSDILVFGFPGKSVRLYLNPGKVNPNLLWPEYIIAEELGHEAPVLTDLVQGELPEIVGSRSGAYGYYQAGEDPTKPWIWVAVSQAGLAGGKFGHGMGVGDINSDGRPDLIERMRWFEQPETLNGKPWKMHSWVKKPYGGGGAQILVNDVDQDGDTDLITSLSAHRYGIAWFENKGKEIFQQHDIIGNEASQNPYGVCFSQPHGMALVDMDGDGRMDFVSGKRYMAHHGKDPGSHQPAVVYWFKNTPKNQGIEFVPFLIDDNSGIGVGVTVMDLNGDSLKDVISANKKGLSIHIQVGVK